MLTIIHLLMPGGDHHLYSSSIKGLHMADPPVMGCSESLSIRRCKLKPDHNSASHFLEWLIDVKNISDSSVDAGGGEAGALICCRRQCKSV